jgi:hypothetical protein
MPIEDTDVPIIDNKADFQIDNQIERIYVYRVTSAPSVTPDVRGLRFYKLPQKHLGLDTFISEDGNYYISAYSFSGTIGYWVIGTKIGGPDYGGQTNRFSSTTTSTFFPYGTPIDTSYSGGTGTLILSKITSN